MLRCAFTLVYVIGLIVALALALRFLGWLLITIEWRTTRCPKCGKNRCMKLANGIAETYPTGRGTGNFYLCQACGQRSFWSNDERDWQDASDAMFDWAYREGG